MKVILKIIKEKEKGIYYHKNGNKYEGDWKNEKRDGKGIFYWNDGRKYEGDFKNNIREGNGILYYTNGKIEKNGIWKNDEFEGN